MTKSHILGFPVIGANRQMKKAVEVANSSGRIVAAHSGTEEGMRRAIAAGVTTIEHGDEGTLEIFKMMKA